MYKKNHTVEFEKYAKNYDLFAKVQKKVAQELIKEINFKPLSILDIGCGTGEIYKNIAWKIDKFIGVDCSRSMCQLHPLSAGVEVICDNFESKAFKDRVSRLAPFDLIISSSALQWAKELEQTLKFYSKLSDKVAFAIFTSGTFETIYKITKRKSFLPSFDSIQMLAEIYKNSNLYKRSYKIEFEDTLSMLRYIKYSGTSGGSELLDYAKIKHLINNYPYRYLEFEVAFLLN